LPTQVPAAADRGSQEIGIHLPDQAFIPGKRGRYPRNWRPGEPSGTRTRAVQAREDFRRTAAAGVFVFTFRGEHLPQVNVRKDGHAPRACQELVVIDYSTETAILAIMGRKRKKKIVAVGRYNMNPDATLQK